MRELAAFGSKCSIAKLIFQLKNINIIVSRFLTIQKELAKDAMRYTVEHCNGASNGRGSPMAKFL
jgi:hypothetical protein